MNADLDYQDHVDKISLELSEALKSQSKIEDEIFRILVHVSPFLGHVIPLRNDITSSYNEKGFKRENRAGFVASKQTCLIHVKSVIDHLEAYYTAKIQDSFCNNHKAECFSDRSHLSNNELNAVCAYVEKLQVLVGHKHAVDKFQIVISKCIDMLLQQFSLYDQNALANLPKLAKECKSLFANVKAVIHKLIYVLTCSKLFNDKNKQLTLIKEVVLEKLSIQLLSLSESIKTGLAKFSSRSKLNKPESSNKQKIKFLSNITSDNMHMSMEMLSNFAVILEEYLSLEKILDNSDILAVLNHKNSKNKKGVLKHHSLELPDLIKTSQHSSRTQSSSRYSKWEWCETLQEFAPVLSSSLVNCLQQTSCKLLQEAKKQCSDNLHDLKAISSISRTFDSIRKEQPRKVLSCIGSVLQLVVRWLPFGIIGKKHRFMSKLHSDFLDVVNEVLKESKQFLMDVIEEIPEKISPSLLSVVLATCIDVVIVLQHCEEKVQQDNRLPFAGTIRLYIGVCNHTNEILLQYHKAQIATSILHDAESNYWSDPRAFAEDERCSYSVEMWQIYLNNLHQELFDKLGNEMTHQIISEIFADSLCILANRYCNCNPSDRRHHQIRRDVLEILRFSFSFLWKILPFSHAICPTKNTITIFSPISNVIFDKIHSACKDLYCCVTVLASPFVELYEVIRMIDQSEIQTASHFMWLSALNVSIFPAGWNGQSSSLSDSAYVFCILKHIVENRDKAMALTLEAMTARQCFLYKKLYLCKPCLTGKDALVLRSLLEVESFQESMQCNFLLLNDDALLTDVEFLRESDDTSYLPWQVVLRNELVANFGNLLLPALHFMSLHCLSSFSKTLCKKLPSEVVSAIPGVYNGDTKEILYFCTILILQGLRSFALSLSPFVTSLLAKIDEKFHKTSSNLHLLHDCYGSHVLLHLARVFLTDQLLLQSLCVELTPAVTTALHEVARFLIETNNLQVNPAEGSEKSHQQLLQEINAYKTCTFSLFSHKHHVDEEKEFNPSKFNHMLETGSIPKSDLIIIKKLSKWITNNFTAIVEQLDLNIANVSKGAYHKISSFLLYAISFAHFCYLERFPQKFSTIFFCFQKSNGLMVCESW